MLYRNTKNGRVIDVESVLHGDWEPAAAPKAVKEEPARQEAAEKPVKKAPEKVPEAAKKAAAADGYVTIKPRTVKKDKK